MLDQLSLDLSARGKLADLAGDAIEPDFDLSGERLPREGWQRAPCGRWGWWRDRLIPQRPIGGLMKAVTCIEDLRELHRKRTPRAFFDYCDRGSYAEETLEANRRDLKAITLRQRVMVDVGQRSTE